MAGCKICLKTGIIICRLELVYRWIWRLCPCKHVHDCWVTSLPWAVPSHWEDFTIWNHYFPLKSLFAKKCHASVNQLHCPNSDFPPYHLIIHRQYISTELLLWLAVSTGLKTVQASRVWNYIWRGSEPTGWYCNFHQYCKLFYVFWLLFNCQGCILDCAEMMDVVVKKGSWYSYGDHRLASELLFLVLGVDFSSVLLVYISISLFGTLIPPLIILCLCFQKGWDKEETKHYSTWETILIFRKK